MPRILIFEKQQMEACYVYFCAHNLMDNNDNILNQHREIYIYMNALEIYIFTTLFQYQLNNILDKSFELFSPA